MTLQDRRQLRSWDLLEQFEYHTNKVQAACSTSLRAISVTSIGGPIPNLHIGIACYIGTIGATAMTGQKPQLVGDPNDRQRQGDKFLEQFEAKHQRVEMIEVYTIWQTLGNTQVLHVCTSIMGTHARALQQPPDRPQLSSEWKCDPENCFH